MCESSPPAAEQPRAQRLAERSRDSLDWPLLLAALSERATTLRAQDACLDLPFLRSFDAAQEALRDLGEMMGLLAESAAPPLGGISDVRAHLIAARKGEILGGQDLLLVAHSLQGLERLHVHLIEQAELAPRLCDRAADVHPLPDLSAWLLSSFDSRGELSASSYPQLRSLRGAKARHHENIRRTLDSLRQDPRYQDALQDDFIAMRNDRYVLPVKSQRRRAGLGIVHDASGTGQTVFLEPHEIVEANNELKMADAELAREERRILRDLSERLARVSGDIRRSLDAAHEIDLLRAKAQLGVDLQASVPTLVREPRLLLKAARHPVLCLKEDEVVPNDLRLGGGARAMILSGPNTGGKTVSLKTLGLAALMVRAGLPIPAAPGSVVGWFPLVLTDIGDLQDVEGGLSTFSGHLLSLKMIFEELDGGEGPALVLLDEIAAGTDPIQGAALGRALLEAFLSRGVLLATTTHYPELKALSAVDDRFVNARVEFDGHAGRPTYRLSLGRPGSSHALDVAARLGIDEQLLERARGFLAPTAADVEELLAGLDGELGEARQDRREAKALLQAASMEAARAQTEREALQKQRRSIERELRAEFEQELRAYRENVRAALRQMKREGSEQSAERARHRINEGANAVRAALDAGATEAVPGPQLDWSVLKEGDRVRLRSLGKDAVLVTLPGNKGRLTVEVRGGMRFGVKVEDLAPHVGGAAPAKGPTQARQGGRTRPPSSPDRLKEQGEHAHRGDHNTLDLRGTRVDEALDSVDAFLDNGAMRGWDHVFLLHGHGTGALKKAVREHLRGSAYVASHGPGSRAQGGEGITIVRLR